MAVASAPQSVIMDKDEKELKNLFNTLESIKGEIVNPELKKKFEELRTQVLALLKKHEEKINILEGEIQRLNNKIDILKRENETVKGQFIAAEITWRFDAHMARFVVDDPAETIKEFGTYRQMNDYLRARNPIHNYLKEIRNKLSIKWSDEHDSLKLELRKERNEKAHPNIDLDELDQLEEFKKMSTYDKERMKDIVNMLKMAASLMKFGRLAASLDSTSKMRLFFNWPQREIYQVLTTIVSWDRKFEDIKGLQNIEHEKANECLQKYIDDSTVEDVYFLIFDFIKEENSKRLGKLAWNIAERCPPDEGSSELEALIALQELLDKPDEKVKEIPCDIAKLHIPDFLPKDLWNGGIEIVKKYEKLYH